MSWWMIWQRYAALKHVEIAVEHEEIDLLLFNFLNELIFYKDARLLLLRVSTLTISRRNDLFSLGEFSAVSGSILPGTT